MPDTDTADPARHVLVTGAAGFIGMHACIALLERGWRVHGVDNLNAYYPVRLKEDRLAWLRRHPAAGRFEFTRLDIADTGAVAAVCGQAAFTHILHLAAQAGVRHSIDHPLDYAHSNLVGTSVILEAARAARIRHLVYASSSSVYGGNTRLPFSEEDRVDRPVSFYAATKRANEAMAYSYAHLYGIPCTGLRFFTVYGPWGRPDMAAWLFTDAILAGRSIRVFEQGRLRRDFTYIDDIVEGICRVMERPAPADDAGAPHALFNIGNHSPNTVNELIAIIEAATGQRARREELPMQPGDVEATFADVARLSAATGFEPATSLESGMRRFVDWFRAYHGR
ncbi:MAG: GDP-mannose 4,6-dehydratase [Gemmatimonadales bacterium]|jgi:UDP-glucuronate 4-epimerase|nr:GDP-mannose 4,6-dehydratase [Gemmatimonadales bacterium]